MATFAGYDDDFLRTTVPLPVPLSPSHATRLDYPHFSVLLMHERRLAGSTAVNIDGAGLAEVPRSGEWHLDPRVPAALQAGTEVYRRNDLDRGHLVRRRDPGWGTDAVAATEAHRSGSGPARECRRAACARSAAAALGTARRTGGHHSGVRVCAPG